MLLLKASNGIDLDISLGALPFEQNCIARASRWLFEDGSYLLTCSAEDLIVHKAFADRGLDWVDIERVIMHGDDECGLEASTGGGAGGNSRGGCGPREPESPGAREPQRLNTANCQLKTPPRSGGR